MGISGPPPIPSKQFWSLGSPANLTAVLDAAAEDAVTVVKYQVRKVSLINSHSAPVRALLLSLILI